jgi:hypothetical protein
MHVSGIYSNNVPAYQSTNTKTQQQFQDEFQQLGQELQSGDLTGLQTTAQTTAEAELGALQSASPESPTATGVSGDPAAPDFNVLQSGSAPVLQADPPHYLPIDGGDDSDNATTEESASLEQNLQSGNSSLAQQAYGSWQQDLQQLGLSSDLLTAQAAAWQPVSLSA